ncbi:MAG: hypothetical protein EBZ47_08530 [Chlamydiae bacterium]|nr:hypothetical protein [Chlamydiota bacterium]
MTLQTLESFSPNGLEYFLKQLEEPTLSGIENTLDCIREMGKSLTEKQIEIDTAVCWELYFREAARKAEEAFVTQEALHAVQSPDKCHSYKRRIASNSRSNTKSQAVKQKKHLAKEASIAQKCGHAIGSGKPKKTRRSNHEVEIVDPCDVAWDVYCYHMEVCDEEYKVQLAQLLEEAEPIAHAKPGP